MRLVTSVLFDQSNLYFASVLLILLENDAACADVVVSEGRDAAGSALVHPENHEHVIALLVRVMEEEPVAARYIHQVALRWLEENPDRAHASSLPGCKLFSQESLELFLGVGQQIQVSDLDAAPPVWLEGVWRLLLLLNHACAIALSKLITGLAQSVHRIDQLVGLPSSN